MRSDRELLRFVAEAHACGRCDGILTEGWLQDLGSSVSKKAQELVYAMSSAQREAVLDAGQIVGAEVVSELADQFAEMGDAKSVGELYTKFKKGVVELPAETQLKLVNLVRAYFPSVFQQVLWYTAEPLVGGNTVHSITANLNDNGWALAGVVGIVTIALYLANVRLILKKDEEKRRQSQGAINRAKMDNDRERKRLLTKIREGEPLSPDEDLWLFWDSHRRGPEAVEFESGWREHWEELNRTWKARHGA